MSDLFDSDTMSLFADSILVISSIEDEGVTDIELYKLGRNSYKEFVKSAYEHALTDFYDMFEDDQEEIEYQEQFYQLNIDVYPFGYSAGEENFAIFIPDTEKEFKLLNIPLQRWTQKHYDIARNLFERSFKEVK